jgi:hypothetical protein
MAEVKEKFTLLKGKQGTMALIPFTENGFVFREGKHAIQPVNAEVRFEWHPYFGTVVKAKDENTILGAVILPVENEKEANEITNSIEQSFDKSGNLVLSFTKSGEKHSFTYNQTEDGLILQ